MLSMASPPELLVSRNTQRGWVSSSTQCGTKIECYQLLIANLPLLEHGKNCSEAVQVNAWVLGIPVSAQCSGCRDSSMRYYYSEKIRREIRRACTVGPHPWWRRWQTHCSCGSSTTEKTRTRTRGWRRRMKEGCKPAMANSCCWVSSTTRSRQCSSSDPYIPQHLPFLLPSYRRTHPYQLPPAPNILLP